MGAVLVVLGQAGLSALWSHHYAEMESIDTTALLIKTLIAPNFGMMGLILIGVLEDQFPEFWS